MLRQAPIEPKNRSTPEKPARSRMLAPMVARVPLPHITV
jgi:hypothetical protein